MAYNPKSKRSSKPYVTQKKSILNGLTANKNIDDIRALANISNQHDSDITAISSDIDTLNQEIDVINQDVTDLKKNKQDKITLTTTGSSGPATFVNNVLNIPQYSGGGLSVSWGSITGTLSSQTDLQTALNSKFDDPTGSSADYLDGTGTPVPFPTFASADKMVTVGRNATGSTLYKGTIVYISGSTGNRPNYVKARANSEATSAGTFGVILSDIPNNTDGNAVTIGTVDSLDTRSNAPQPFTNDTLIDGDTIYLSPTTPGYVTRVKPSAPNHLVYIGKVVRTSPTNGTIVYRIQNGYELDEIHDVAISSAANNDILQYELSTDLWKNKSLSAAGIQPTITTAALTKVDDTNVTLTLGGAPSTALLQGVSLTLGWTGRLDDIRIASAAVWNAKQEALSSGVNIKTIEGQSILGSGNIDLTKSDVGLSNVDNTSDLSKPISTATQTALNAKQDTLVSATNIKTINGSSVLGSGDLVVGGGGGGTHTPFKFNTYNSFYATSAAFNNSNVGVFAFQSNFMITYPFIPKFGFTCTQLYINVTSLAVGSLGRISIYQDSNGLPVTKLYESADLDLSTGGQKTATTSFVFTAGTVYWLAFQCNTITTTIISGIPVANCINFAFNGTTPINSFTRTVTFGTNAPTPFTPQASGSNILPFIGLRI